MTTNANVKTTARSKPNLAITPHCEERVASSATEVEGPGRNCMCGRGLVRYHRPTVRDVSTTSTQLGRTLPQKGLTVPEKRKIGAASSRNEPVQGESDPA